MYLKDSHVKEDRRYDNMLHQTRNYSSFAIAVDDIGNAFAFADLANNYGDKFG